MNDDPFSGRESSRSKKLFFHSFFIDILPLGSGSVDLHIFADPDPGRQILADPTDRDPKHCI